MSLLPRPLIATILLIGITTCSAQITAKESVSANIVKKLNLKTCYELALLRMETIGLSEEDVRIAQARYSQAIGEMFPSIKATGTQYDFKNQASTMTSPVGMSTDLTPRQAGIGVKIPLFSGFRDVELLKAARRQVNANRQTTIRTRQNLYLNVAETFFQSINYAEDLQIMTEINTTLENRVKDLETRVRLGKTRISQLLQAQTSLAQVKVTAEHTRGLYGATQEMLAFLIGIAPQQINLENDSPSFPENQSLVEYLNKIGDRPDILAAIETEQAARARLSAAKGEHFPTVNADGNYTFYDSNRQQNGNWTASLTVEFPIFEGGSIEARVDENKALFAQRKLDLSQLQRTAERDVRTAFNNFNSALAELAQAREAVKTADLNYHTQVTDYELKIVNNMEVLDALQSLQSLRRDEASSRANAHINLVRLYVAAGSKLKMEN